MGHQEIDSKVRQWLASDEACTVLDRLSREISASFSFKRLSPVFLMKDPFGDYVPDDLIHDIRGELALFITENSSLLSDVLTSKSRNPYPYLKQAFLNYWITRTRAPGADRQRHLYKRIQDILRTSDKFHTVSKRGRSTAFSMSADSREIPGLAAEDLSDIAFPLGRVEYKSVNKKDALILLAAHFWKQVSETWGNIPVWVDIRDFVAWIGIHVSLKGPVVEKENPRGGCLVESAPDPASGPDAQYYDRDLVMMWAQKFFNRLTDKERAVFRLHYGAEMKFGQIARELGYRGGSGPKYIMDCIEKKLRFFLADLPWLSPDDYVRDAFQLFLETVLSFLNDAVEKP